MQQFSEPHGEMAGQSFRYRFLGQGSQYRVYAVLTFDGIRTGRVIKIPLSLGEIERAVVHYISISDLDNSWSREHLARQKAQKLLRSRQALPQIIEGVNGGHAELMHAIGDTKVLPQAIPQLNSGTGEIFLPIIYTQQEVTPLSAFFDDFRSSDGNFGQITPESIKKVHFIFQKICELHMLLWRYGFFESTFNLRNMGYVNSALPEVVLFDVGEMLTSIDEAQSRLAERPWLYNVAQLKPDYQYLPPVLHRIFKEECEKYFTSACLSQYWQSQKKSVEQYYADQLLQQELLASDPEQQVYFWVRRQNLATQLYQGMVDERLERTPFNSSDLRMLQDDIRLESTRDGKLEHSERVSADSNWRPKPLT